MFHCRIKRISDERYYALRGMAYPVFERIPVFSYIRRYQGVDEEPLSLAEYYAFMRIRFGDSGSLYDDWKGIFSFPFEVEVFKDNHCYQYVLNVLNWRSTVELRYSRVCTGEQDFKVDTYREPIEDEFSSSEMAFVDAFLYGLLLAFRKNQRFFEIPDFVRKIEMQCAILGRCDGNFFVWQYEDGDEFWADIRKNPGLKATAIREEKWPDEYEQEWIDIKSSGPLPKSTEIDSLTKQ